MLYEVNLGIRDYFTYTDAMLNNSLFSYYLKNNNLNIYKNKITETESTRDIICLDFDFGSKSYEENKKRIENKITIINKEINIEKNQDKLQEKIKEKENLEKILERIELNKSLYSSKTKNELREYFYMNGVSVTYKIKTKDNNKRDTTDNYKKDNENNSTVIKYKMLFRTPAKAKLGQVIFINEKLYDKAYNWLTMGLGDKMPYDNAMIVELSAYMTLTTSTIIDTINIPVNDVLILKDQNSFFKTIVKTVSVNEEKKCIVKDEEMNVKNTLWDGMGIIESSILPKTINGMILLRQHFFKMCGIKGHIQKFFKKWCENNGYDYNSYQIKDMFGKSHYLKDIKIITTDNAIKWKKFISIMGGSLESAYLYWCERVQETNNIWGIVKTDHPSKLGEYQQLSYQMINTLPCKKEELENIAKQTINYIELIKNDNLEFEKFLRKNANEINHYEMLADLYNQNHDFENCKWFRNEKKEIVKSYIKRLRKGKIFVEGDNLTVFGNPYALLLYSIGENWSNDKTLNVEEGCIQCYTPRFKNGEYLAAFRNPHNSPNNICYMHNVYSNELQEYFEFSSNVVAINCIGTDIQDRANGMDEDSDFMLFTNQKDIIRCAKDCYLNYPTIVNKINESNIKYNNLKEDYAKMDNKFSGSQMGIGWSSNLAQMALTYYWTEKSKKYPNKILLKELYDIFIILSVLAQIIIDGCKREYEIDAMNEIKRISKLNCMNFEKQIIDENEKIKTIKCDFPRFMKYTREVKYIKDGEVLPEEVIDLKNNQLNNRINYSFQCPMNWLEEIFDKIKNASTSKTLPTSDFFIKMNGKANHRQMSKICLLIEKYDSFVKNIYMSKENDEIILKKMIEESNNLLEELKKIKIRNIITINRLIETSLSLDKEIGMNKKGQKNCTKYTRKLLNYLYRMDKNKFLINFKSSEEIKKMQN